MYIRRVTAHAFGHLRSQSLPLTEGLTVVYGPNESGKSTWHAALLAALCGRWPSRARDEPGIERRRPWAGSEWVVSAEVHLPDGRRVELWHDLEARHGYAKDLDMVVDHSPEITGSARGEVPDASRWLGLDRRAFVATACVRQSHLVLASQDASGMRSYVERAAATAPADETAAAALTRIDAFQREHIGTERSTTRPLPVAQQRRAEAADALALARAALAEFEERAVEARRLRAQEQAALVRLRRYEAAVARADADRLQARAAQAHELADLVAPEATEPASSAPVGSAASARAGAGSIAATVVSTTDVVAAVEAWRATQAIPPLGSGDTPTGVAPSGTGRRRSVPLLALAATVIVAAVVLFVVGAVVGGAALAALGAVTAAVGLVQAGRESATRRAAEPGPPAAELYGAWEQRRVDAERRVVAIAGELGLPVERAVDAVRGLDAWLAADRDRQAARERFAAHRARLETLLDGASLADLDAAADRARQRAADLLSVVDYSTVDDGGSTMDDDVDTLRREHQEADRRASLAEQALVTLGARQPPVAEAEERLAAAEAECQRLRALEDVLTRTRTFLARAQERVHRDIAPHLASALARDLTAVSGGRYTEAVVDPGSLAVRVRGAGGPLRDVADLSLGTVEQVYLLLRVALAERLVRPGESCPLLLDDVTVHADQERTSHILDVLLAVAQRHQVVLFTQQEQVRQWARATLTDARHCLVELSTLAPV
jgi:recombinational DNA repair ATPase RecF